MWLSKKQTKSNNNGSTVLDKLAAKIADFIMKIQISFGNWMNQLFNKMSIMKIKLVLISFCFLIGGYSIFLLVEGITNDQKSENILRNNPKISIDFKSNNIQIIEPPKFINSETYRRIEQFKYLLDSLKQYGSYKYDSIIKARPFLMDSILILEEIYQSQNQK